MALKDVIKVNRKTYYNPRAWLGYDSLKSQSSYVWQFVSNILIKPLTTSPQPKHIETFEQAISRLQLTEEDIAKASKLYFLSSLLFALLGVGMLVIVGNYLLTWHFAATLAGLGMAAFLFSQAFRFHFWHFQIKHRKLGCTFEEWYQGKPHGGDDHHA